MAAPKRKKPEEPALPRRRGIGGDEPYFFQYFRRL